MDKRAFVRVREDGLSEMIKEGLLDTGPLRVGPLSAGAQGVGPLGARPQGGSDCCPLLPSLSFPDIWSGSALWGGGSGLF